MSRKGIGTWFNFKKMSPPKAVTLVFVASILLIVISYGIWQFGRLISPSQTFSDPPDPVIALSVTDYYQDGPGVYEPLPNNIADRTPPYFNANNVQIPLTFDNTTRKLNMARLEIQLDYR